LRRPSWLLSCSPTNGSLMSTPQKACSLPSVAGSHSHSPPLPQCECHCVCTACTMRCCVIRQLLSIACLCANPVSQLLTPHAMPRCRATPGISCYEHTLAGCFHCAKGVLDSHKLVLSCICVLCLAAQRASGLQCLHLCGYYCHCYMVRLYLTPLLHIRTTYRVCCTNGSYADILRPGQCAFRGNLHMCFGTVVNQGQQRWQGEVHTQYIMMTCQ
jgi:hypothetical protein